MPIRIGIEALLQLQDEVQADLHWHPFELNPMVPPGGGILEEVENE